MKEDIETSNCETTNGKWKQPRSSLVEIIINLSKKTYRRTGPTKGSRNHQLTIKAITAIRKQKKLNG